MIGAIGDFVGWAYMKYIFIGAGISIFVGFILLIREHIKS